MLIIFYRHAFQPGIVKYNQLMERLLDGDIKANPNMASREAATRFHYDADRAL